MPPIRSAAAALACLISCVFLPETVHGQQPFDFFTNVATNFLSDQANTPNEASGLEIAPDGSHLIVVSDEGKIFFLNLLDYESGHCMVDLSSDPGFNSNNWEAVAIDTGDWDKQNNNMNAYIVHEGSSTDAPILYKIKYTYDISTNPASCSITKVAEYSLVGATECLTGGNGIESLALKNPSDGTNLATFYAGVQDTGKVYEITSTGLSNGQSCYDGGLGVPDVSASSYDDSTGYLWSAYSNIHRVTVLDPEVNCELATYYTGIPSETNKEGLLIDFERNLMYIASDSNGDTPSTVGVYNFTHPDASELDSSKYCCGDGKCDGGTEDCSTCARDCDGKSNGNPKGRFCCKGPGNLCDGPGCGTSTCPGEGLGATFCSGFTSCGGGGGGTGGDTVVPTVSPTPQPTKGTLRQTCCILHSPQFRLDLTHTYS